MTKYEKYCKLRDAKNMKDSNVAALTGIGKSTFSDWKSGRSEPKNDKLQKIANSEKQKQTANILTHFDKVSHEVSHEISPKMVCPGRTMKK